MAEIIKDGFTFYDRFKKEAIFSFAPDNRADIQRSIEYIKKNKVKYISLSEKLLEKVDNLDFLGDMDFIEEIYISKYDMDFSGIYKLKNLKALSVIYQKVTPTIDYSRFEKLEDLSIDWYNKEIDLSENKNLKKLIIWKFKPKNKSFSYIKLPQSIESLEVTESNIHNLEGLELANLKHFEGHYCTKLTSLSGLKESADHLQSLTLSSCGSLVNYQELEHCKNLEKIILTRCGEMQSLSWLKNLKKVSHISFLHTKVIDGDIRYCLGIKYVAFTNSRHYNYKMEQFSTPH
ncbi:hypothetical protein [Chryseobacterium populi]|uniref:Leucine Rich Repeat (LRR)-containing protein n=1 Tax=Chryseobacterium populi TaxID=1144316 RepID=J3CMB1_9FLAO|nr:hypothetical protein [Chryseobacterium populi]EJL74391.1 hypothetical protein PMI13_01130 [Chryseobacterium populi]